MDKIDIYMSGKALCAAEKIISSSGSRLHWETDGTWLAKTILDVYVPVGARVRSLEHTLGLTQKTLREALDLDLSLERKE